MDCLAESEFPVWGLIPKKETEVDTFLKKHPEYDGAGITIAIFDSGVDPGAPGLQCTSAGQEKIIARYDCTGSGDVELSEYIDPKDGTLVGLTGRILLIPSGWDNPSNKYKLGVKSAYELYPEKLKERIKEQRKERLWDESHKNDIANCNRNINEHDRKVTPENNTYARKLERENYTSKLDVLNTLERKYMDLGPVYDVVVFKDSLGIWNACLDTSEVGDLDKCTVLREYDVIHEYAPLTYSDQLNFSINVHEGAKILEIVTVCSSHGTHVASIASAYFPECTEKNGVAPGAQIVSLTIGDGRLKSMETGTALVRAMIKVIQLQSTTPIHIINMSYGEHAHWSDFGRIGELINEIVNKYGIIWVASAGNNGPALSTIGTPPDLNQETLIGVGAYVSPSMMVAEYALTKKLPGMPYTWTSRGPTMDGGFGVSVCAPGGAITSVPNFTLRNSQLMNGTSMAAPHVAGAIGLLLSGLKQKDLQYSPYHIKRSIEFTAQLLDNVDPFAQGNGLLQVDKAFLHLVKHNDVLERDLRFQISCGACETKGIHFRSKYLNTAHDLSVVVEPCFLNSKGTPAQKKIDFSMKLVFSCDAQYVKHPEHLHLSNMSRLFHVQIDPRGLETGAYTTSLNAFDTACVYKGPVFRVPITIIQPIILENNCTSMHWDNILFNPGTLRRHFFVVPDNASWAVIKMKSVKFGASGNFVVHAVQILPRQSCKTLETNKNELVTWRGDTVVGFQVRGGINLEFVITKYWANIGEVALNYCIHFYGVKANVPNVVMQASDGVHCLEIKTFQNEEIAPSVVLKHCVQVVKPSDSKINTLSTRDMIPPNRQINELILTYNFRLTKGTEVCPSCPLLSDVLYESEMESQLWMLYDSNKQILGCGDAYPSKYAITLEKGDYIIRLNIRHDKKEQLDKLTETPMVISQKLPSPITMELFAYHNDAINLYKKLVSGYLYHSEHYVPAYIAPLAMDKFVVKNNNPANYLTGTITYTKDEIGKKVDTYSFKYILNDSTVVKKNQKSTEKEENKWEDYSDSLRDLKVSYLARIDNQENATKIFDDLKESHPEHVPTYMAMLQFLDPIEAKRMCPVFDPSEAHQKNAIIPHETILELCNAIISIVKPESLLAYFSIKKDTRNDAAKVKSLMEKHRSAYIEAISRSGITISRQNFSFSRYSGLRVNKDEEATKEKISNLWTELLKYVDLTDARTPPVAFYFGMWHAVYFDHFGRLFAYMFKLREENNSRDLEEKLVESLKLEGLDHIAVYIEKFMPIRYPLAYKPF